MITRCIKTLALSDRIGVFRRFNGGNSTELIHNNKRWIKIHVKIYYADDCFHEQVKKFLLIKFANAV